MRAFNVGILRFTLLLGIVEIVLTKRYVQQNLIIENNILAEIQNRRNSDCNENDNNDVINIFMWLRVETDCMTCT